MPASAGPIAQPECDREVEQVPREAVQEGDAIGAGHVEDAARHPAAQRHAEHRRHDDHADARTRFLRREIFADDDRIARHDAALEQAEQQRDDVERRQARRTGNRATSATACMNGADQQRPHAAECDRR